MILVSVQCHELHWTDNNNNKRANSEITTVELLKSYCLPFLLYGFDALTLSDANARVLDKCLDRAVYRSFGVCDKDNVSLLHKFLGLHSVSKLVSMQTC